MAGGSFNKVESWMGRRWPWLTDHIVRAKMRIHGEFLGEAAEFLTVLRQADLVVLSGGGDFNDEFESSAMTELALLDLAMAYGAVTSILGQGIGPIRRPNSVLGHRMRAVLPSVDFICLREALMGPDILQAHGVAASRLAITGDDAIEMAYGARNGSVGKDIGVNVRFATYSGFSDEDSPNISALLTDVAEHKGASLRPVPISVTESPSDLEAIKTMLKGSARVAGMDAPLEWPSDVIRQVAYCRLVVTSSYHAAVFALAQGIPAIGLVKTEYYRSKFLGLADQFGIGCTVVEADGEGWVGKLRDAIESAWMSTENVRPRLLHAAEDQIKRGRLAYARLRDLAAARPNGSGSLPRTIASSEKDARCA
jgi:colanic acid/amylovoran biosynthesis protein